jgi:hypothetical protein
MIGNIRVVQSGSGTTLSDSVSLESSTVGASATAVKTAYDKAVYGSNLVTSTSNDLYGTSNIVVTTSNNLYGTSNLIAMISNDLYGTSNIVVTTSNDLYRMKPSARDYLFTTSGFAFTVDGFSGTNPDIWVSPGFTYSFKLSTSGHPFQIRVNDGGSAVTDGMYWAGGSGSANGALANNGRQDGTLYWTVPQSQSNVVYQCQFHSSMVGNIFVNTIGGSGSLTDSVSLTSSIIGASATAAKTCYDKAVSASNIAATAAAMVTQLAGTSNLWSQGNTSVFTMDFVSIGKSNADYQLDVSGTIKADSVLGANILTKELQGNVVIGNTQSQVFTMNPSMIGNFYNLYVGPTTGGKAYFAQAIVMMDSDETAVVSTIASNNNISISTLSSNVMISTSGIVGLTYKWSLYKA